MLVKVLRPECLLETVRKFVETELGAVFVSTFGFDLQDIFEESNSTTPLIFILSSGTKTATRLKITAEIMPDIMTKLNGFYPNVVILHGQYPISGRYFSALN